MKSVRVTRRDIDELLAYAPRFEDCERSGIVRWSGGEQLADGSFTMHHPEYDQEMEAFFMLAGKPCWCDYGYHPAQAGEMVRNDELIARASLDEIRTMLTFCVRGERFCDGHWEAMAREGRIRAILRRLQELRQVLPP